MSEMTPDQWMDQWLPSFENALETRLQQGDPYDAKLWEAMNYSLTAGGKRLRPVFLMMTGMALGQSEDVLLPFAMALEMIHTYSLIHDDLPAMDNDDYRRGRLTNHKVYGEAMAILAGDGLLNLAAEIMADEVVRTKSEGAMKAMQVILHAAGPKGMIAGQTADLLAESETVGEEGLAYIDHNKTGQLITAAFLAGAHLAGAGQETVSVLEEAGFAIGTAFQIQDDILDIEGSQEILGKAIGSDAQNNKETFVTVYGMERAKEASRTLSEQAVQDLQVLPGLFGSKVRELVSALVTRTR